MVYMEMLQYTEQKSLILCAVYTLSSPEIDVIIVTMVDEMWRVRI